MNSKQSSNIMIYQAPNGAIELKGDLNTETIRHITKGFTINKTVLEKNYTLFNKAIQALTHHSDVSSDDILYHAPYCY